MKIIGKFISKKGNEYEVHKENNLFSIYVIRDGYYARTSFKIIEDLLNYYSFNTESILKQLKKQIWI